MKIEILDNKVADLKFEIEDIRKRKDKAIILVGSEYLYFNDNVHIHDKLGTPGTSVTALRVIPSHCYVARRWISYLLSVCQYLIPLIPYSVGDSRKHRLKIHNIYIEYIKFSARQICVPNYSVMCTDGILGT